MSKDQGILYRELPLNGRLRTNQDPSTIGPSDFQTYTNYRPGKAHPQGVGGTTKINTTVLANPKIKNAHHFRKDFPSSESHVLVHALDANSQNGKVYRNSTAIPNQGNFNATNLFTDTDTTGTKLGRFSDAPGGMAAYCNGGDTAIWGGDEMRCSGFIDYDPNGTYRYDYTRHITNSLTDSENVATLHSATATVDANTVLLLHFDGDSTDSSPATVHTQTDTGMLYPTGTKKFGTNSAQFNGSTSNIAVSYDAATDDDFDFSSGVFTIDFWIYNTGGANQTIFWQRTDDTNYMRLYIGSNDNIGFEVVATSQVVSVETAVNMLPASQWAHVAVVGDGSAYYIFINGLYRGYSSDSDKPVEYTETPFIGCKNLAGPTKSQYFTGYLDEFRISKVARWTVDFSPPTQPYGTGSTITSLLVGSNLPLHNTTKVGGVTFYVGGTANATSGTPSGYYWNGSGWVSLGTITRTDSAGTTISDGIPFSGGSLPDKQEKWSWPVSATNPTIKAEDDVVRYWYKFEATDVDASVTLSQVTLDAPFQSLPDLWDGVPRSVAAFQLFSSSIYNDYTTNVFEDAFDSANTATFAELDSLPTSTGKLFAGFFDQQMGLKIGLIGGHTNATACTVTVEYYNGGDPSADSGWTELSVEDRTSVNNASFGKSGLIMWNPPSKTTEFKTYIAGIAGRMNVITQSKTNKSLIHDASGNEASYWETTFLYPQDASPSIPTSKVALYYYRISFSATLDSDVQIFHVGGIPAQGDITGYTFPLHHANRLFLFGSEDKEPNAWICSAQNTAQVFNGNDSVKDYIGDDTAPVAAASLHSRFGSSLTNLIIVCKKDSTWGIEGTFPNDFRQYPISFSHGCVAPLTMDVGEMRGELGPGRQYAVWQSSQGIVVSYGGAPELISDDIEDKFWPRHANYVGASTLATCTGYIDHNLNEYHWVVPDSQHWVYSFDERKWFRKDEGTGAKPNGGLSVYSTSGIAYPYEFIDSGYLVRAENGTSFVTASSTNDITHTLQTGDIALHNGSVITRTELRSVRLIGVAKETTSATIALSHYGDSSTTASTPAITALSMSNSGKRMMNVFRSVGRVPFNHIFHSFKLVTSTNNETIGQEPIYLVAGYKVLGDDVR